MKKSLKPSRERFNPTPPSIRREGDPKGHPPFIFSSRLIHTITSVLLSILTKRMHRSVLTRHTVKFSAAIPIWQVSVFAVKLWNFRAKTSIPPVKTGMTVSLTVFPTPVRVRAGIRVMIIPHTFRELKKLFTRQVLTHRFVSVPTTGGMKPLKYAKNFLKTSRKMLLCR